MIGEEKPKSRQWRKVALAVAVVFVLCVWAVLIWDFYLGKKEPPLEAASDEKMAFPLPKKPSIAVLPDTHGRKPVGIYFSEQFVNWV